MASTWAGTADNELLTAAALKDCPYISSSCAGNVPTGDALTFCTNDYIVSKVGTSPYICAFGAPGQPGNQLPTKAEFSSQF